MKNPGVPLNPARPNLVTTTAIGVCQVPVMAAFLPDMDHAPTAVIHLVGRCVAKLELIVTQTVAQPVEEALPLQDRKTTKLQDVHSGRLTRMSKHTLSGNPSIL